MSNWQAEKAERNRRSLARLSKALPPNFPPAVLARAFGRPFIPPTPRLAIESYWQAHPSALIVWHALWRLALALPSDGHGESATAARLDWQRPSERRRLLTENQPTAWVQGFAVYAASPFIGSAGTRICGMPDQTRMRSGIVPASSLGSFGTRRTARQHSCVGCKAGAAAKQANGCGRMPRWTTGSRCFQSGGTIAMKDGRNCFAIGGYQTFR